MKKGMLYGVLAVSGLLAVAVTTGFAQQFGNRQGQGQGGPGGGMQMPPRLEMKTTATGVYVLQGNVLTRYTAGTLQKDGQATFAEPTVTKQTTDQQAPPRPMVADFTITDTAVLAVIGNDFYNLDVKTLAVKAKATLPEPPQPPQAGPNGQGQGDRQQGGPGGGQGMRGGPGGGQGMQGGPGGEQGMRGGPGGGQGMRGGPGGPNGPMGQQMQLTATGNTLYVLRGPQLLAVDIATGNVTGTVTMAKPEAK